MKKELKNFKSLINAICKKTGIYQEDLAKRMGYAPETLSRIVTGVSKLTPSAIEKLSKVLDVHPVTIIHDITERDVLLCSEIIKKFTDVNPNHDEVQHALHNVGIELQDKLIKNCSLTN